MLDEKCGNCIKRCIFDANLKINGKSAVNSEKCMGCGLCVSNCLGRARQMAVRHDYSHDHQVPAEILLGNKF